MQTTLQLKKTRLCTFRTFSCDLHDCNVYFLFTTLPENKWILLTVLVVSAGIEPGLILRRSKHRMGGTLAALLILVPLIYLMQLNYRFIPVLFIIAVIALNVTALNIQRYDISVFFVTLSVFLLLAQTTDTNSPQGPFEMMINRGICTLIGILIVLMGDYFLFQSYRYSHKLYFSSNDSLQFLKEKFKKLNYNIPKVKIAFFLSSECESSLLTIFLLLPSVQKI